MMALRNFRLDNEVCWGLLTVSNWCCARWFSAYLLIVECWNLFDLKDRFFVRCVVHGGPLQMRRLLRARSQSPHLLQKPFLNDPSSTSSSFISLVGDRSLFRAGNKLPLCDTAKPRKKPRSSSPELRPPLVAWIQTSLAAT